MWYGVVLCILPLWSINPMPFWRIIINDSYAVASLVAIFCLSLFFIYPKNSLYPLGLYEFECLCRRSVVCLWKKRWMKIQPLDFIMCMQMAKMRESSLLAKRITDSSLIWSEFARKIPKWRYSLFPLRILTRISSCSALGTSV